MNIRTAILCAASLSLLGPAAHAQSSQSDKPSQSDKSGQAALAAAQAEADKEDLPPGWPREGATLLVSSHVMDEAERCDTLLLLREGRVLAAGPPAELRARTEASSLDEAFLRLVESGS